MHWGWEDIGTLSNVVMGAAAVVALVYAHLQITESRRAERRTDANELWRETLHLGFDNPTLSDPRSELAKFDYVNLTVDGSKELFQKYELFVDTILNASEEILADTSVALQAPQIPVGRANDAHVHGLRSGGSERKHFLRL